MWRKKGQILSQRMSASYARQRLFAHCLDSMIESLCDTPIRQEIVQSISQRFVSLCALARFLNLPQSLLFIEACQYLYLSNQHLDAEHPQLRDNAVLLIKYLLFFKKLVLVFPESFEQELKQRRTNHSMMRCPDLIVRTLNDETLKIETDEAGAKAQAFIEKSLGEQLVEQKNAVRRVFFEAVSNSDFSDKSTVLNLLNAFLFVANSPECLSVDDFEALTEVEFCRLVVLLKQALWAFLYTDEQAYIQVLLEFVKQAKQRESIEDALTTNKTPTDKTDDKPCESDVSAEEQFNLKQIFIFELESLKLHFKDFSEAQTIADANSKRADMIRAAHSIKGSAAIAGYQTMSSLFAEVERYLGSQLVISLENIKHIQELATHCEDYLSVYISSNASSKPSAESALTHSQKTLKHWLNNAHHNDEFERWQTDIKNWLCSDESGLVMLDPGEMDERELIRYELQVGELFNLLKRSRYNDFEYFLALYCAQLKEVISKRAPLSNLEVFITVLESSLNAIMISESPEISDELLFRLETQGHKSMSVDEAFFYNRCKHLIDEVRQSLKKQTSIPLFGWIKKELKSLIQAANYLSLYALSGLFFSLFRVMAEFSNHNLGKSPLAFSILNQAEILIHRRQYYSQYSTEGMLEAIESIDVAFSDIPSLKVNDSFDDEITEIFQQEAQVLLKGVKENLDKWEKSPKSGHFSKAIQRLLHTFKGSARLVGFKQAAKYAHKFEGVLSDNTQIDFTEFNQLYQNLLSSLEPKDAQLKASSPISTGEPKEKQILYRGELGVARSNLEKQLSLAGEAIVIRDRIERQMRSVASVVEEFDRTLERLLAQTKRLEQESEPAHLLPSLNKNMDEELELENYSVLQGISQVINESVSDIKDIRDSIVRRNQLTQEFLSTQNKVNMQLQQALLSVRQTEFAHIIPRLKATCEKNSLELKKDANLKVKNKQLKIDQSVLEQLVTPLEHMIRNALDHGIETPEERVQQNKPKVATILIEIKKTTSEYEINVSDDGRGLNLAKVRQKALERGLINADEELSDKQCVQLIFSPGFSTANKITDISGRGFGLDIVDYDIKKLGGQIDVQANSLEGVQFSIRLPFGLSQNKALFVQQASQRFAIPLGHIKSTLKITDELDIRDGKLHYLSQTYQILNLSQLINLRQRNDVEQANLQPALLLINALQPTAILVDKLLAFKEIVIKRLSQHFTGFSPVTGGSILADGHIVPILDLPALLLKQSQTDVVATPLLDSQYSSSTERAPLILVVDDSVTVRKYTSRMLRSKGYRALRARDGLEAIEQMQKQVPDLVLLDIEMPNMDGFEVASQMKHDEQLKGVPIIMISSRSGKKYKQKAQSLGIQYFLNKPYDNQELLALIKEI